MPPRASPSPRCALQRHPRGPGGVLPDETRFERFTFDVNRATGQVGNCQVAQTLTFTNDGSPFDGLEPSPASVLGHAFDPEGFVVNPAAGTLLVADEYGPSLVAFTRNDSHWSPATHDAAARGRSPNVSPRPLPGPRSV